MLVPGCPRFRQQGVLMGEAAKFLKYPRCPGLLGKCLGLYGENTVQSGGKLHREMLLVLFSCGKGCSKGGTGLGLFCTLLAGMRCSYNSYLNSVTVPYPWTPRCSTWTDQSWSRSSGSSSLIFGNQLLTYSSRWKHSTCISFSPCWLQAPFSNYILLSFSTSQFSCCLHSARNNIFL